MSRPAVAALLTAILIAPFATAQTTAVRAARMLDVVSGEMHEDVTVLVDGERIVAVDPQVLPDDVTVLDLGDRTLLPGFMDMHTHINSTLEGDWVHGAVLVSEADAALTGAANARLTLEAGFTTIRDLGSAHFADVALRRAVDRGLLPGPRIVSAGHSIGITGGHADATGYAPGVVENTPEHGIADGPDEVLKAIRYQIKHGATVIKVVATAGVLSFEGPVGAQQMTLEELQVAADEAHRHGLRIAAHAHGAEGILAAVEAGIDSIEHGSTLTDEIIARMLEKGTFLVPTTYLADAIDLDKLPPPIRRKAETILPIAKQSLTKAIAAGVRIAYGTDAAVYPHGDNAKEFAVLVERGMTPLAALQSATIHAAELLGVDDRGVIAPDKLADLVAVPGNPLDDITATERVDFVMKGGEVFLAP